MIWIHANTNVITLIFLRVFNDSVRYFTRFRSGASHGQPSDLKCMPSRNADGACFSTVFEGNRVTVCGFGKLFAADIDHLDSCQHERDNLHFPKGFQ